MAYLSITLSFIALLISGLTFWLIRIKSGVLKMTRPTVIFFGPDGVGQEHKKVFLRTLLYSTSERGKYIQNMYIKLIRGKTIQMFNVWVYDDKGLVRGSGLFVNKSGITSNHHFLMPKSQSKYDFLEGEYLLQLFVETVGKKPKKIFEQKLNLTKSQEEKIMNKGAGVYFDWAPNAQNYFSHIDDRPKKDKEIESYIKMLTSK